MSKRPGHPARGTTSGRPIMVLLDVLGKRWTLRIIWELNLSAPVSFRALQARCDDVSPTVLNNRLKELRALKIIDLGADGYGLTEAGLSLSRMLVPLDAWAKTWAGDLSD